MSFVTISEMEIRRVTVARFRAARGEFTRARVDPSDSAADIVCFAEFVIPVFGGRWPTNATGLSCWRLSTGPYRSITLTKLARVMNYACEQSTSFVPFCIIDNF